MKRFLVTKHLLEKLVCLILIVSLTGCNLNWNRSQVPKVSDKELMPTMARVIDEQLEVVLPYLDEELSGEVSRALLATSMDGRAVVDSTLEEQAGRDYLEFGYAVATTEDAQMVVDYARNLLPADEFAVLEGKVSEARSLMFSKGEELSRALPPHQRQAFMKDLQKLVTRTIVLLVAGIVYACIPKVVFWGKITAAAAIAIAAGIVATTIMSIWRYYEFDMDKDVAFEDWLKSVTTEPETAYALAASIIAMGTTLKRGPIVTGIILGVFAIYNVIDLVKPMLKTYNFNA